MASSTSDGESQVRKGPVSFPPLDVEFSSESWGPMRVPEQYKDMPFAPFSKGDRLGKVSDFGGYLAYTQHYGRGGREENAEIGYQHDTQMDKKFELVDSSKTQKRKTNRRPRKDAPVAGDRGWEDKATGRMTRQQRKIMNQGSSMNKRREKLNKAKFESRKRQPGWRVHREPSVKIGSDWQHLEQFDLSQLNKLQTSEPSADDLKWCGRLSKYDVQYDRVTAKKPKNLARYENKDFYYVSSAEDPVLQEYSAEEAGNVFATDAVLSHIMTCPRSVYPWDIIITYIGGTIFLDVRDPLEFEMHTVNETSRYPPPESEEYADDPNYRENLELEATTIHQNFIQQALNGPADPKEDLGLDELEDNPFWDPEEAEEGHEPARLAYRYRKWELSGGITVVARTTVNAINVKGDERNLMTLHALNEWDSKMAGTNPWAKSIDTQRGALIAQEVQNNGFKLAKWTAATTLAGADEMKIGFVSRLHSKSNESHNILGTQMYAPDMFAHQMSLSRVNMWGILKWLVELVRTHAENLRDSDTAPEEHVCKFVLMRDPNQPTVALFSVPTNAFDEDEDSDEESESEDESEGEEEEEGAEEAQ